MCAYQNMKPYPPTIIATAEKTNYINYQLEAEKTAARCNSISNYTELVICDISYKELLIENELGNIFNPVLSKLEFIQSFTVQKFNNETFKYTLKHESKTYTMTLVKNDSNQITAIEFHKNEWLQMNHAA